MKLERNISLNEQLALRACSLEQELLDDRVSGFRDTELI